tara:strand:- start:206 stop:838 length:633 start_codon:yes stop_codon:yes gene_type:complete
MITFLYFDFNFWRVDVPRLCLSFANIQHRLKSISRADFIIQKKRGAFPFGQLPVMIVNKNMYGQTIAISKYCASLASLYSENKDECLIIDQVLSWANDINSKIAPSIREKNKVKQIKLRNKFVRNDLVTWFNYLERIYEKRVGNENFFLKKFSLADITAWRIIHWFKSGKLDLVNPDFLRKFRKLNTFYESVNKYDAFNKIKLYQEIITK